MIAGGQVKMTELRAKGVLQGYSTTLLDKDKTRLGRILDPFLRKYDHHGEGRIDLTQMHALLADVHEAIPPAEVQRWVARLDPGGRGSIETSGLVDAMLH